MTDTPVMSAPPGSSEPAMPTMSSRLGLDDSLTITHIPASTAGAAGKGKLVNGQPAAVGPAPVALSSRRSEKIDLDTVERKGKRPRDPGPRQHAGGVKEAKTFRPTKEEWKNPMAYMRSIAEEGSTYGIIKIVPPDSWAPDFAMDTEVSTSISTMLKVERPWANSYSDFTSRQGSKSSTRSKEVCMIRCSPIYFLTPIRHTSKSQLHRAAPEVPQAVRPRDALSMR